jgi:hypothetical protein
MAKPVGNVLALALLCAMLVGCAELQKAICDKPAPVPAPPPPPIAVAAPMLVK